MRSASSRIPATAAPRPRLKQPAPRSSASRSIATDWSPRICRSCTASLLYITPSHQYPTGATLSQPTPGRYIAWARRYGCYIIEDDYDCDIRYEGSHLQPIAALAPDCTIYLGTFSKSLGAGLRLGFMVVPEHIAEAVRIEKSLLNHGNPWLEQATLADFMRSGSYAAHLAARPRRITGITAIAWWPRCAAISAMSCSMARWAGLHVLWHLPPGMPDALTVEALAQRAGVGVYSLSSARVHFQQRTALTGRALILGYAALSQKQIEKGIARLSDVIDDAIDDPATDMSAFSSTSSGRRSRSPAPRAAKSPPLAPRLRQQPALRTSAIASGTFAATILRQGGVPMPVLKNIYRYPIKGLSAQPLARVDLEARKPLPSRPDLCVGSSRRAVRHQRTEMGQKRPVRDVDAGGGAGPGQDHA